MPPERDLFANFERMRREMDELFGDVFHRSGMAPRKRAGFSPAVDVAYADDPPRAIVTAELAGIDADRLGLEIQGRELVLTGERRSTPPTTTPQTARDRSRPPDDRGRQTGRRARDRGADAAGAAGDAAGPAAAR